MPYTTGTLENYTAIVNYDYSDPDWGDLLTSYNGQSITYDTIGNPLSDGTWTYTWEHGSQLSQMTIGDNVLRFAYDASGLARTVTWNGTVYYYATNLQGDIIAILDADGNAVAEYIYDAWGNIHSTSGTLSATLGTLNPLRYRGYVYDNETGLYYLQSRYYNPETGRFINVDGYVTTGQGFAGFNMFAYCSNNPVMMYDPTGEIGFWAIVGAIAVVALILCIPSSEQQEPTNEQIEAAETAAERAKLTIGQDSAEKQTIHIHIDTKDTLDTVDRIAMDHYYESLHEKTVEKANEHKIPIENLMTVSHITWEFELHAVAYYLGFDAALVTDLDVDETPWSMFKRAIGW